MKADIQVILIRGDSRNPATQFVKRLALGYRTSDKSIVIGISGVDSFVLNVAARKQSRVGDRKYST
jgi:hypothetical protein